LGAKTYSPPACDTLTVIRSIIDAMSLKMCPLGLAVALLVDT
jgi:hypothetical protein